MKKSRKQKNVKSYTREEVLNVVYNGHVIDYANMDMASEALLWEDSFEEEENED